MDNDILKLKRLVVLQDTLVRHLVEKLGECVDLDKDNKETKKLLEALYLYAGLLGTYLVNSQTTISAEFDKSYIQFLADEKPENLESLKQDLYDIMGQENFKKLLGGKS